MQAVLKLLAKVAAKTIIMVLTTLFKTSDPNLFMSKFDFNCIYYIFLVYFNVELVDFNNP